MAEEQGSDPIPVMVSFGLKLDDSHWVQTGPLHAFYTFKSGAEIFDLVALRDADHETFKRYRESIESVTLYADESLLAQIQEPPSPLVAIGSNRNGLNPLDTDTKGPEAFTPAALSALSLSDAEFLAAAQMAIRKED